MGQSWWWVVLAVAAVALLVAVALLGARRRRADAIPPSDVEIAAAAAGGAVGAVGAAAVAATRAKDPVDADAGAIEAESADEASARDEDAREAAPNHQATERAGEGALERSDPSAAAAGVPQPRVAAGSAATTASAAGAASLGTGGPVGEPAAGGEPLDENAPADGLAPGGERRLSGSTGKATDQRMPEPAGSALAALDSGLIGPATSFTAAVLAATARPGPYPGSLLPAADGSAPSPDHRVKANEGSRRYHTPDSPYYVRTRGDAWFRTAEEARAAGFTAWDAGR